jgi:hypothetical protein
VWAGLTAATFCALEGSALRRNDSPATLTYTLRSLLGIAPRRPRYHIRVGLFYAFLLWTGAHISTGRLGIDIRWPAREFAPMAYLDGE